MSGSLYDRLLDGLHGGVGPIREVLLAQTKRVAQRVSGITYHGLRQTIRAVCCTLISKE
ncbi:hypothetical protein [Xylella fastidiosa]|uniref:hypothetical protein n=1 Tax=Xylella fastidiosa TaxID=2371 RepID=UPI0035D4B0A3